MKVSDGTTTLDIEQKEEVLEVRLVSTQLKKSAIDLMPTSVEITEIDENWLLTYKLPSGTDKSFMTSILQATTRLDKLRLAGKLAVIAKLDGQFNIPFLHPENIFIVGAEAHIMHFGLDELVEPFALREEEYLARYKALILLIFNVNNSFESLVLGEHTSLESFTQEIQEITNIADLKSFINEELLFEEKEAKARLVTVDKKSYWFFKYFGMFAIVLLSIFGWVTYTYQSNGQKQEAIITAQLDFLTNNHAAVQTGLQNYTLGSLPKSARYILAMSAVNLSDLTTSQKQAVLNTISLKSDDNTLNYWGYTGRGDFTAALDLAKNLGDKQLTLFAYTNLYETTKLNMTMNGEQKQKLLDEYNKEIQALAKSLGH